jgi:hypothetical protein
MHLRTLVPTMRTLFQPTLEALIVEGKCTREDDIRIVQLRMTMQQIEQLEAQRGQKV